MGGWLLAGALSVGAAGCEQDAPLPPPPSRERSNVVLAPGTTAYPRPTGTATASSAPKAPRALCTGSTAGLEIPKAPIELAKAAGARLPPATIPFGAGKWIWINLWAAWCVPCKQEMPMLLRWHGELRRAGVLLDFAFVSLDDDERQLRRFLEEQPASGLRSSYWLPEGARAGWLRPIGVRESMELPVQILVSPRGEVRCVIEGAVEEHDYPALLAYLRKP